jgi:two-component system response regulator
MVFPDGKKLVAKAQAKWEGETVRVDYAGEMAKLKPFAAKGTLEFIEWYLRGIAGNYEAELTLSVTGEYNSGAAGTKPVVLVAEDDGNDFELLELAFLKNRLWSRLVRAHDGAEALDYLKGEGQFPNREEYPFPKLMLLDLKMPRMGGFEVLASLRSLKVPELPVVVLSGSVLEEDKRRARELGASDYFVKPTDFNEVVKMAKAVHERWLK